VTFIESGKSALADARNVRRGLFSAFVVTAAGGAAIAALAGTAAPSATAAPDPCAASQVAKTVGTVATNTGTYLDSHPETNAAFTTALQSQQGPAALGQIKNYMDANPQVAKDMQGLQRPLTDLAGRCDLPITLPQVLQLMQAAQAQGGAALPGGLPSAQTVGVPGVATPAGSSPVSAVSQGTGPLPGPIAGGTR
jgi:hemophore